MAIEVSETIAAPRDKVWDIITDLDSAAQTISGIESLEILERPASGLVGLKWRETRTMFGKSATETMWITDAEHEHFYETRAESHGSIYRSRLSLADGSEATKLTMKFSAEPVALLARLFAPLSFLFEGSVRKAFEKDLQDIKRRAEAL